MNRLQCELCGSVEIIKIDNNVFQCQFCKCKYTAEQARAMIGVVEVTKGNAELNRLLNNAEAQVKLKNYIKAIKIYDSLSNEYPSEHIVWKKYLEFYYSEIRERKNFSILDNKGYFGCGNIKYPAFTTIQSSAISTCPESDLNDFRAYIENFWTGIYNDILNDKFRLFYEYYSWLNVAGEFHPLMQKMVDECKSITRKLNNMNIHYGYADGENSSKVSYWYNDYADAINTNIHVVSILGKICVCSVKKQWADRAKLTEFVLPFNATDTEEFYTKVREIAQSNHYNLSSCPYCNGKIKTSLFGKRYCINCKRNITNI